MGKSTDAVKTDERLLTIAAARLRSEGLTQGEIGQRLGKTQPEISRLLTLAQELRFLARAPTFLSQNIAREELEEVERRFFVDVDLQRALKDVAPRGLHLDARVIPAGDGEFAFSAAGRVAAL